jgi:plasmid stabilization system protein ParE
VATVEWGALARQDLLSIIGFISDDNPEAAQRLKNEIEARIADLASHPKMYRQVARRAPGKWSCTQTTWLFTAKTPKPSSFYVSFMRPGSGPRDRRKQESHTAAWDSQPLGSVTQRNRSTSLRSSAAREFSSSAVMARLETTSRCSLFAMAMLCRLLLSMVAVLLCS